MNNLPAHETKELDILDYLLPNGARVNIKQDGSSPDSTGKSHFGFLEVSLSLTESSQGR